MREFDDLGTAKLAGFRDAEDYYCQCSSGQFLITIQTPTLIIRALDDPFFTPSDVPWDILNANTCLYPAIIKHGGHVGFIEGYTLAAGGLVSRQTRFLVQHLKN